MAAAIVPGGLGAAAVVTQTMLELVTPAVLVLVIPQIVPLTAVSENR